VDGLVAAVKEAGADLLVVGTHGRGAAGRFIAGSVSVGVARKAPCDVLVVP
jgi:nucleotide-binding universal stress UspA family protein